MLEGCTWELENLMSQQRIWMEETISPMISAAMGDLKCCARPGVEVALESREPRPR